MNRNVILKSTITVSGNLNTYEFSFAVHRSKSVEDLRIENDFYLKLSPKGQVPDRVHHEIEVLTDMNGEQFHGSHKEKIHIHESVKFPGKKFICWTMPVENTEKARAIMKLWAIGTAFTIEYGKSFTESTDFTFETSNGIGVDQIDRLRWIIQEYGLKITKVIST